MIFIQDQGFSGYFTNSMNIVSEYLKNLESILKLPLKTTTGRCILL